MSRVQQLKLLPFHYARGVALWEAGTPVPERPEDEECNGPMSERAQLWFGYMLARGVDWMERRKIAELCGASDREIDELPIRG